MFEATQLKIRRFVGYYARKQYAAWWLALFSFTEASFFPIAPDLFLIALLLIRKRWIYYLAITTIASAFGGVAGYLLGFLFFQTVGASIISFYSLEHDMQVVEELFKENAFLAIFTAAFTPIPYKVFTIAGGFFQINIWVFLAASILGRGARFFIIGYLMSLYGERLKFLILKYFNIFSILFIVLVVVYIMLLGS